MHAWRYIACVQYNIASTDALCLCLYIDMSILTTILANSKMNIVIMMMDNTITPQTILQQMATVCSPQIFFMSHDLASTYNVHPFQESTWRLK